MIMKATLAPFQYLPGRSSQSESDEDTAKTVVTKPVGGDGSGGGGTRGGEEDISDDAQAKGSVIQPSGGKLSSLLGKNKVSGLLHSPENLNFGTC